MKILALPSYVAYVFTKLIGGARLLAILIYFIDFILIFFIGVLSGFAITKVPRIENLLEKLNFKWLWVGIIWEIGGILLVGINRTIAFALAWPLTLVYFLTWSLFRPFECFGSGCMAGIIYIPIYLSFLLSIGLFFVLLLGNVYEKIKRVQID